MKSFFLAFLLLFAAPASAYCAADLSLGVGQEGQLGSWLVLGPVASSPPVDPSAFRVTPRADERQAKATWRAVHHRGRLMSLKGPRGSAFYLAVGLRADRARRVLLAAGSDDGLEVWLNGEVCLSRFLERHAVPDTDLVTMDLPAGSSTLVVKLVKGGPAPLRAYFRLLGEDFAPAAGVRIVLPGAGETRTALAATGALVLTRRVDLEAGALEVSAALVFEAAVPAADGLPWRLDLGGASFEASGVLDLGRGPAAYALAARRVIAERVPAEARLTVGEAVFRAPFGFRPRDVARLVAAAKDLRSAAADARLPVSSRDSVAWRIDNLRRLIEAGDQDYSFIDKELREVAEDARTLASGKDPYADRRGGMQRRAYRSSIDGGLRYYALYVPPGWREQGTRRFGLVVALHGLNGRPVKTLQTVFGSPLPANETTERRERHPEPLPRPSKLFVLAPDGFGNSNWRAYGEVDVLEAMDAVAARYRIDPERVYITGASMGGTGAAAIPLHFPDRFAAAAPLCGYHVLTELNALRGVALRPFERFQASVRSGADWAANGRHVPLYVVHGLRDMPLSSKVLVERYRQRGYRVEYEMPDLGHNVWDRTYEGGAIFDRFAGFARAAHPRKVTFHTARLRYRSSHWLAIDDVGDWQAWTRVEAEWAKDGAIAVSTENTAALTVQNDAVLSGGDPVRLSVDGQPVPLADPDGAAWHLRREGGLWREGTVPPCPGLCKRPGLAGPIDDALFEPLLFVFGTADPVEERIARRIVDELRDRGTGVTVDWPVKADVDVTDADLAGHAVVIVGTTAGNSLLARMADRLPIRVEGGALVAGAARFSGPTVAASFIHPNPLAPDRYVVVHTGVTANALYFAAHLPSLLPDYVVYDGAAFGRKGGLAFGDREPLAAGSFESDWSLPASP